MLLTPSSNTRTWKEHQMKLLGAKLQPSEADDSPPWIYQPSLVTDAKGLLWFPCTITFFFSPQPNMKQIGISQTLRFLQHFKLQGKDRHYSSIITNTVWVLIASSPVQDINTKGWWRRAEEPAFEQPPLTKTAESETWGLCTATSKSYLWSFPFFPHFFLSVIFLLIYLNQSLLISRPKPIL